MSKKTIFVVMTGVNGLGKTTQIEALLKALTERSLRVTRTKYPHYNLEPYGPRLNAYLRKGNPENLSAEDFQRLQSEERRSFEPTLRKMLEEYDVVIAEDYIMTSFAWGLGADVDLETLRGFNEGLLQPDLYILLDGKPFPSGKESGHRHEENNGLIQRVRGAFLALAGGRKDCPVIDANRAQDVVTNDILNHILSLLT